MAIRDIIMAAAGATTGSSALYVEDVFAVTQYSANNGTQTITNGIDLAGKGGLIWFKSRTVTESHSLLDSVRGIYSILLTEGTYTAQSSGNTLSSFNSNGFTLGADSGWGIVNRSTYAGSMAAWTFRTAPKFFDVVTYTGFGSNYNVPHSLGVVPGLVIVKNLTTGGVSSWWATQHRYDTTKILQLNTNAGSFSNSGYFGTHTSTYISTINGTTAVNTSGNTYVAYLFAHDAGGFGATGTDSISYCGSYTGNGSASGPTVTIGWEPQYLMIKRVDSTGDWNILDTTRGMSTTDALLKANTTATQSTSSDFVTQSSTGFQIVSSDDQFNASGGTYIYLAIRKAMKV